MSRSDNKIFNVLHVVSRLPVGGVENMLLKVVEGYDRRRFNASVCCIKEGGEIADELIRSGYRLDILDKMKKHGFDYGAVRALYDLMRRKKIDILRTHQYHANLYGRIAGILAGVPIIIPSFHNVYESPNKPKLHRRLINYFLSYFSDALIAVSETVASDIIRHDRVNPGKIRVIYNGIELEKFRGGLSKKEAKTILNLSGNLPIIGSTGRLTGQKGHRFLIEAASRIENVCVAIVGEGPLMDELKNQAKKLRVNCIFPGQLNKEQIPVFLRAIDIFCFPSLWEGFGTSLVEAMAEGLPVVASDIAPHREVLDGSGLLIQPGDVDLLAKSLEKLLGNVSLRKSFAKKARDRASIFSIDQTLEKYEKLFKEKLGYENI